MFPREYYGSARDCTVTAALNKTLIRHFQMINFLLQSRNFIKFFFSFFSRSDVDTLIRCGNLPDYTYYTKRLHRACNDNKKLYIVVWIQTVTVYIWCLFLMALVSWMRSSKALKNKIGITDNYWAKLCSRETRSRINVALLKMVRRAI